MTTGSVSFSVCRGLECKYRLYSCMFKGSRTHTVLFALHSNDCTSSVLRGLEWILGVECVYFVLKGLIQILSACFALKYQVCCVCTCSGASVTHCKSLKRFHNRVEAISLSNIEDVCETLFFFFWSVQGFPHHSNHF